jgi:hypothetical protein
VYVKIRQFDSNIFSKRHQLSNEISNARNEILRFSLPHKHRTTMTATESPLKTRRKSRVKPARGPKDSPHTKAARRKAVDNKNQKEKWEKARFKEAKVSLLRLAAHEVILLKRDNNNRLPHGGWPKLIKRWKVVADIEQGASSFVSTHSIEYQAHIWQLGRHGQPFLP